MVKRRPGMAIDDFHHHWRTVHSPLNCETPSIARYFVRYERNHRAKADYARPGASDFDGAAVEWYPSVRAFYDMIGEPAYGELIAPTGIASSTATASCGSDRGGRDDHRLMEVGNAIAAAEDDHWWYRNTRALIAGLCNRRHRATHHRAGCGPGGNGAWLASHGRVIGVDLAQEALEFVRARRPATAPVMASAALRPLTAFDVAVGITLL
jgi:hypothetical protein